MIFTSLLLLYALPVIAYGATLSFSPASGTYEVGSPLSVAVTVGSPNNAVNAMSGVVSFDENLLEVTSISKNQSIVSLWVQEPSFSNTVGTVNFEGIVLNPGFSGASGKIATVNFRVKQEGTGALSFSSGSVLANDGSGTDVLSKLNTAQFTLSAQAVVHEDIDVQSLTPEVVTEDGTPLPPRIMSQTHGADVWSSQISGVFNFEVAEDITAVRLLLDHLPNSVPTVVYEPAITMREVTDLTEGVSYLHVQFKNAKGWGTINHYKLQIDTHAPDSFVISEVAQGVFKFDAKDSLSGIASYKVQIDDREVVDFVDNGDHLYGAPLLSAGAHTLRATAFDKAGNSISATIDFILHATLVAEIVSEPPTLKENLVEKGQLMVTILSIVIPFVALVLLLLALLYSVWHSRGGLRKRIDKEVLEAKMIVHKAFALLRDDLAEDVIALERASKKRKLTTTEAKIMKRLKQNINEAEEVISKEVDDVLTHIR